MGNILSCFSRLFCVFEYCKNVKFALYVGSKPCTALKRPYNWPSQIESFVTFKVLPSKITIYSMSQNISFPDKYTWVYAFYEVIEIWNFSYILLNWYSMIAIVYYKSSWPCKISYDGNVCGNVDIVKVMSPCK